MSRPEHIAPADIFYNLEEAEKYANNSRMINIQTQMSERAIELMCLPKDKRCRILDVGCGSGLSGEALSDLGHDWVGVDISPSMLGVAVKREVEGDVLCVDIGQGLNFRPGSFDGCISISVLQWLCNADKKEHIPQRRLKAFFQSLYNCLRRGSRAIFQFYPETSDALKMITDAAMRTGFSGGVVVDYPNSAKAKKVFLCLFAGEADDGYQTPQALGVDPVDGQQEQVLFTEGVNTHKSSRRRQKRAPVKSKQWILQKKDRMRKQGKRVAKDSKFAGRRRKPRF